MLSDAYRRLWEDDALQERIERDTRRHRMGDIAVCVTGADGGPRPGVEVRVEQTGSHILFGANLFMVDAYEGAAAERFERHFVELFNAGTLSLYWRDLEPAPGTLRFAADSPRIRRRPPVDVALAFAQRHGLNVNGHPLVWDFRRWSVPPWLSDADCRRGDCWERRIAQIAERYGHVIPRWDVVNEVLSSPKRPAESVPMPEGYARKSFAWAQRHLPDAAHLMINETTHDAWHGGRAAYRALVEGLIADGAKVDGIGLQFHAFTDDAMARIGGGELHRPTELLAALDDLGTLGRPLTPHPPSP